MATLTWIAATSGVWTTASNWSPAQVPAAGDTVLVNQSGAYQVNLSTAAETANLTMADAFGVIDVSGSLQIDSGLTIAAGTLEVASAGTLNANASGFSNTGTLVDNGVVVVNGTLATAALQNIGGIGGFYVNGTVANTGATLDLTPLGTLALTFYPNAIAGGDVTNGSNVQLSNLSLEGVTWLGTLGLFGTLAISDGLTLTTAGGSGPGTLTALGDPSTNTIDFVNSQTFDNAKVVGFATIVAGTTLAIGSGATFDLVTGRDFVPSSYIFNGGTIVSHGTIFGDSNDSTNDGFNRNGLISLTATDFENAGVLSAIDISAPGTVGVGSPLDTTNPGEMAISIGDPTFANEASGIIEVGQSAGIGLLTVSAATVFTNNGTILTQAPSATAGGTVDVAAFLGGSGAIDLTGGGVVIVEGGAASAQSLDFTGAGTLILDQAGSMAAAINGFNPTDAIEINAGATAVSYSSGDLKLQIVGSASTLDLAITGTHSLANFIINTAGASTEIQIACFAVGTRIATPRGEIAVEHLCEGDSVLTVSGTQRSIRWIGRRTVDCRHHPAREHVLPIRIAPHAFGLGRPARALLLSPDHAVFAEGVLIPIKLLANGSTVQQVDVDTITYCHIELDRHDVVLAEGLPAESYLETGGRNAFENAGPMLQLHPNFTPDPARVALAWEAYGYAPLLVEGRQLEQARQKLAWQAALLGNASRLPRRRKRQVA